LAGYAQVRHAIPVPLNLEDSIRNARSQKRYDVNNQLDLIDVARAFIRRGTPKRVDTSLQTSTKVRISALPAAGYTLQTGFAIIGVANAVFHTSKEANENVSSIVTNVTYSQYKQIIFPIQGNIWTKDNKYNIVSDWRYLKFPSLTYGLGGYTSLTDGYSIDYSALRIHQSLLKRMIPDIYAGLGYDFDYFWNIKELDPPAGKETDFERYGLQKTETASGVTVNFLFDDRKNSVNADSGEYASITYRPNFTFLGSDANWQSLIFDLRKYIRLPAGTENVLAFWSYDWFTLGGNPPYLLLPSTGGDPYTNTGRGYIQGRYRGRNMLYLEGEYRFQITNNGLLGGVVFANAESFTEQASNNFEVISPGYGAGLRIKLNKFSRTNVAVDYGFGVGGSRGFFVNLGEVF